MVLVCLLHSLYQEVVESKGRSVWPSFILHQCFSLSFTHCVSMAPLPTKLAEVVGDIPNNKGFLRVCIQATVEADLWDQFRDQVEEHALYTMKNFHVEVNDVILKPATHSYRLFFKQATKVRLLDLGSFQSFPQDIYKFKTDEEINATPEYNINHLIGNC